MERQISVGIFRPNEICGSPPEVIPNIPVRRNRNGPSHLNSNRNFRNLWHNGKHPVCLCGHMTMTSQNGKRRHLGEVKNVMLWQVMHSFCLFCLIPGSSNHKKRRPGLSFCRVPKGSTNQGEQSVFVPTDRRRKWLLAAICTGNADLPTPDKGKSGDPWKKIWRFYNK